MSLMGRLPARTAKKHMHMPSNQIVHVLNILTVANIMNVVGNIFSMGIRDIYN